MVVAIHDVSPAVLEQAAALRRLVRGRVEGPVAWLVVPRNDGTERWTGVTAARLRTAMGGDDETVLHGYTHRSASGDRAEFRGAPLALVRDRITRGIIELSRSGIAPIGHLPPCYVAPRAAAAQHSRLGVSWWATRWHLHAAGRSFRFPSLGVGASTAVRRAVSPVGARAAAEAYRHVPVVRIDLHPADIEHPELVGASARILDCLLGQDRRLTTHRDEIAGRSRAGASISAGARPPHPARYGVDRAPSHR